MKVVFITLGFSPYRNSGFDVSGERYVKLLLENDFEVIVIAGGNSYDYEAPSFPNLKIIRVPIGRSNWIGYSIRASKVANHVDGVKHFWDIYLAYSYRSEFIASLHQSFNQRIEILKKQRLGLSDSILRKFYYHLAMKLAERPSLERSRYLLAVSNATKNEYIKNYNVEKDKLILTPHYIDSSFFSRKSDVSSIRSYYGLKENVPVLLFAGFINPRK